MAKNTPNDSKREKAIQEIIEMRVSQMASTKSLLNHLMFKHTYTREVATMMIGEMRKRIQDMFKEEHEQAYHNAIARLEELIEKAENQKIRLDAIKEMNKLLGLHKPQKVDITSGGDKLTDIKVIKLIEASPEKKNEDDENKGTV
jgi:Ser-tRNA(Ala) deacylase AlaX